MRGESDRISGSLNLRRWQGESPATGFLRWIVDHEVFDARYRSGWASNLGRM